MLLNLRLTNFRRHQDLTVDFTPGLQAIRAPNEGGKSTLIEAAAYALFGTKALRTSLDDTVTWDHDVKTLKAALDYQAEGTIYTFTRGKSGAEVLKNGEVFVTGQNEVSAFAAKLLGADSNVAAKMMFASQNGLRGALEEGPKALSTLIEDLAGFTVFDQILEAAQEKLALGSPALLEERLKGAEATLEAATQNLPAKPDVGAHTAALNELNAKVTTLTAALPDLKVKAETTFNVWMESATQYGRRAPLERDIEQAQGRLVEAKKQVALYAGDAAKEVDASRIDTLKAQITEAEDFDKRAAAYQVFAGRPVFEVYPGTEAQYDAALSTVYAAARTAIETVGETEKAITAANYRRINHDKCDKCGQDITHLTHVKETNAAVDAALAVLVPKLEAAKAELKLLEAKEDEHLTFRASAKTLAPSLSKLQAYCTIDDSVYPAVVTWVGSVPGDGVDVGTLKREMIALEAEVKALDQAKAKLEMATGMVTKAEAEVAGAEKALAELVSPSASEVVKAQEDKDYAEIQFKGAEGNLYLAQLEIERVKSEFDTAAKLWGMAQARIDDAEKVIAECKKDLGSLAFNNALIKKLRALRPVIADKLWNTVLTSVSVMFSQLRQEESWISKDKDGFKANGQSIESLSGSTLDLLGLALRSTLIRTFLPACGLLVLDEPAHGCDTARTESLLGFLAGAGFQQTLLVTHDAISESVANNIITL